MVVPHLVDKLARHPPKLRGDLKQALAVQVGELELHNELGKVLAVDDELLVELDHSQSHLEDKCAVVALTE